MEAEFLQMTDGRLSIFDKAAVVDGRGNIGDSSLNQEAV